MTADRKRYGYDGAHMSLWQRLEVATLWGLCAAAGMLLLLGTLGVDLTRDEKITWLVSLTVAGVAVGLGQSSRNGR